MWPNMNNLLAAISGKAYLGHNKAKQSHPEEPFTKHFADIKNLSLDASVLIKQLLSFSRESRHEKQNVDFTELVNNAVDTASFGLLKNIEMDVDLPGQSMMVHVDPVYLKQAIINLINNARDAVEFTDTKKITIRLAHVEHKQHCIQHQVCDSHSSDVVMLEIEDSGCGINSADIGKLFDPFFTTKPSGKGTGLGLSTARGIILAHNGSLTSSPRMNSGDSISI